MIFIKVLISNTYQNRHVKQIEVHCNINLIVILLVVDLLRNWCSGCSTSYPKAGKWN